MPKNPGIRFLRIPGSGFSKNLGIPGYPWIPQGPVYETKIKSEILIFAVIGRFMVSLDLMNFRKSGSRVQKFLSDKEEEECVFSVAFSS